MPKSQGMTLVEVLVALTLITIMSTGFMVASLQALRMSQEVSMREAALLLVRDAAERLRTHKLTLSQLQTVSGLGQQSTSHHECYQQACSPLEWAMADWQQLNHRLHRQLPEAKWHLQPACGNGSVVSCLWVTWRGADIQDCIKARLTVSRHEREPGCIGVTLWLSGVSNASS